MDALFLSNLLLWIVVIILSLVVFALMRQIGVLHERVFPAGALMSSTGPQVGESSPQQSVTTLNNEVITFNNDTTSTLLLFISPTCPVCKTLIPIVNSVKRVENTQQQPLQVLFCSDGEETEHREFIARQSISAAHYVLSATLGLGFLVEKLPFAVLLDSSGLIRAKGIVNSREHLESLFEAYERGVASLQQYLAEPETNTTHSQG